MTEERVKRKLSAILSAKERAIEICLKYKGVFNMLHRQKSEYPSD